MGIHVTIFLRTSPQPECKGLRQRIFAQLSLHSRIAGIFSGSVSPLSLGRRSIFLLAVLLSCRVLGMASASIAGGSGLLEAGVPPFRVTSAESIGLSTPPTDLRIMPDGRLLVVANRQLAMGDGSRWQVFSQAPGDPEVAGAMAAVAENGDIYLGTPKGICRVQFDTTGHWRLQTATPWPESTGPSAATVDLCTVDKLTGAWFWHSLTGPVYQWKPGEPVRRVGQANTLDAVFQFGTDIVVSDRNGGIISRLRDDQREVIQSLGAFSAITASQPHGDVILVGTYGEGLGIFDGDRVRPLPVSGLQAGGNRINDICPAPGGLYVAAVDNVGLVLFQADGHLIQILNRLSDHRLAGVTRLLAAPDGSTWALARGALAQVQFASRLSNFEPLLGNGVVTVHPFRFGPGDSLYWLGNGIIHEGRYNAEGRLLDVLPDSPPRTYVNSLAKIGGLVIAGTESGAYFREKSEWRPLDSSARGLHILDPQPYNGRWLFSALNEIGWLRLSPAGPSIDERFAFPGLGAVLNRSLKDAQGRIWLELGVGQVGRADPTGDRPQLRIFTTDDGLANAWPQLFLLDGRIHLNLSTKLFRFDDRSQRFAPADDLQAELFGTSQPFGRIGQDPAGRLWFSAEGMVQIAERRNGHWQRLPGRIDPGFQPYYFTFEPTGIAWMHAARRLARFDPRALEQPPKPLAARITTAASPGSGHLYFADSGGLPALPHAENSLVFHYLASGGPPTAAVIFDVMLDRGDRAEWIPNGSSGRITFSNLKEGNYTFRVRPQAAGITGSEASLSFTILPPWYRTIRAYSLYALLASLVVVSLIMLPSRWARR
ncbi:MAG: hypothetical protein QG602_188, partial [Verrucomicrobiota bacterium]|nr:hypothetical protein [Verrucomicrobiota bacterium]